MTDDINKVPEQPADPQIPESHQESVPAIHEDAAEPDNSSNPNENADIRITKKENPFINRFSIRVALILLVITGTVTLILAGVNALTIDKITERVKEASDNARLEVLPEAASFSLIDYSEDNVVSVYQAFDAGGNILGFAVETSTNGFSGKISEIVGIYITESVFGSSKNYSLSVSGVSLLDISEETPGIGSKVAVSSFLSQFSDMTDSDLSSFNAVSGATYSSAGVLSGVETALDIVTRIITASGGTVK